MKRPHIVTHLFADGGRIIKSTRTDYSEHLDRADLQATIRRLMKEQHKAMFIALRDGQLNETIEKVLGPGAISEVAAEEIAEPKAAPRTPPGARRSKPPPTLPNVPAGEAMSLPPELDDLDPVSSAPTQRRPAPTLTDLVLADLESARSRGGAAVAAAAGRPAAHGGTPVLGTPATQQRPAVPAAAGRYAPARPANIFSPEPEPASIFGGSSISEQSLDEVILSYLAEDLDGIGDE
ncbi:MAG TPA: hypothetical protein VHC69_31185 [Polyangiaceae bacterium]|nr:hypothetical protein [Polyangiaceae bacterium]